jgi:hypothetical protein
MTEAPLPTTYRLFEAFWKLILGSPKLRFASLLVRSGTVLAAGPPLLLALATLLSDVAFPRPQGTTGTVIAVGTPVAGFMLIAFGIRFFLKHVDPPQLEDSFGVHLTEGQTFETATRTILAHEGKAIRFSGFTAEELARSVRAQQLQTRDSLSAVRALGDAVRGQPAFPFYDVIEHEGVIDIRRAL